MKKHSIRIEFDESTHKQIFKAAKLQDRSAKKFSELAVIAATIQTLTKKK